MLETRVGERLREAVVLGLDAAEAARGTRTLRALADADPVEALQGRPETPPWLA